MILSAELNKQIIEFLASLPNVHDNSGQQALILRAGLDPQLRQQIHFGGSPAQFFPLLVNTLLAYGKLDDEREALEAVLKAAKDAVGKDKKRYCDSLIQKIRATSKSERTTQQFFDLLIIDDRETWRKLVIEVCKDLSFSYDAASDYESAREKIHQNNYKAVCMNLKLKTLNKGRILLKILSERYSHIPVALMSGHFSGALLSRYSNVKEIIAKSPESEDEELLEELFRIIPHLISTTWHKNNFPMKKGGNMILELLTTETIKAVVKFLASQAEKFADRVNTDQLAQIEQKAEAAKTEEEVCAVQTLIKEAIPDVETLASLKAFAEWVEDQIDQDFNELLGVGELTFKVVRELRKQEEDLMKKDNLKDMEKLVKIELESFKKQLTQRTVTIEDKANLYDRITNTLENICK